MGPRSRVRGYEGTRTGGNGLGQGSGQQALMDGVQGWRVRKGERIWKQG